MNDVWERLDPRTLATQPVAVVAKSVIPAVAGFVGVGSAVGFNLAVPITIVGVVLAGAVPWLTTTYRVTRTHLEIRRGLLNRSTVTARLDRVRSVDLQADVVHRMLGVTKVSVGTGVDERRLELDSLGVADAERLRVALLHRTGPAEVTAGEPALPEPEQVVVRLDWAWMRFAPLNVANLAVALAAVGALASQFQNLVDEQQVESAWNRLRDADVPLVAGGLAVSGVVLWVLCACLGYAVRWYGLTITREQGKNGPTLRRVHGALTQRATTVEEAKVRGVVVRRRALVGLAGGAELSVLTTGLDDNQTHLLPSSPRAVVESAAADVLGEPDAVVTGVTPHGRRARRRQHLRNLRKTIVAAAVAALAVWASRQGSLALSAWIPVAVLLLGVPVAVSTAELRYRRLGHALTERYLVSCTGTFTATRTALETDGVVGWRIHQSFWDRRRGLAQLTATTAAGQEHVLVPDVPVGEAVAVAHAATPRMVEGFLA